MPKNKILCLLLILTLSASLGGCNYPAAPWMPTSTATPTATLPPTPTSPPPTNTPPPPTEVVAPTPPPAPTNTQGPPPPTAVPPTPVPPTATQVTITPVPRSLFTGSFTGGSLTFRVHDNSKLVIPKTVTVKGITCKQGGKISDHITFEPPPMFEIANLKFTITQGDQVTIDGQFLTATSARGTITLKLGEGSGNCTIGPLPWTASSGG